MILFGEADIYPRIENFGCRPEGNTAFFTVGKLIKINIFIRAVGFFKVKVTGANITDKPSPGAQMWGDEIYNFKVRPMLNGLHYYAVNVSNVATFRFCTVTVVILSSPLAAHFKIPHSILLSYFRPKNLSVTLNVLNWDVSEPLTCTVTSADGIPTLVTFSDKARSATFDKLITTEGCQQLNGNCRTSYGSFPIKPSDKICLFYDLKMASIQISDNETAEDGGLGVYKDKFNSDRCLRFQIVAFVGTAANATLLISHKETNKFEVLQILDDQPAYHRFSEVGAYTIQAILSNPKTSIMTYQHITIDPAVRGMSLHVTDFSLKTGVPGFLLINFLTIADTACICVDQGDGKSVAYPSFKLTTVCSHCPTAFHLYQRPINGRLNVSLYYHSAGTYKITVTAGRPQDAPVVSTLEITVEDSVISCVPPKVIFTDPNLR
uniref:PKD domain-containing protein n=1 Tax=Mesocestoides corti TaxID=53468 RepID=A0A5K3ETS2_MESCO